MIPLITGQDRSMSQSEVMHQAPLVEPAPDSWPALPSQCSLLTLYTPEPVAPSHRLSKSLLCSTKPRNSRHQTFHVPRSESSSPASPMCRPHSLEAMRAVISHAMPNVSIESLQPSPSARLLRDVIVKVSDGRTLMLTIPPPLTLRLLRSEQWLVLSEALVLRWMFRKLLEHTPRDKRTSINYLIETEPEGERSPSEPVTSPHVESCPSDVLDGSLLRYLPALIAHSPSSPELGTAFNFLEPTRGSPISILPDPLTIRERSTIEFQKGQLIRRISNFTAPGSRFGPAVAVIGPPTPARERSATPALVGSGGVETWTKAFLALLEGILRDGEDLAVMMSYSLIRGHVRRLSHLLDAVTQSRLVVLDAGTDANVLVSRSTKATEAKTPACSVPLTAAETRTANGPRAAPTQEVPGGGEGEGLGRADKTKESAGSQPEGQDAVDDDDHSTTRSPNLAVTGLRDWSNCIFGDPLMSSVFSQDPSAAFLRGFSKHLPASLSRHGRATTFRPLFSTPPPSTTDTASDDDDDDAIDDDDNEGEEDEEEDIIEDHENAPVRLLLYECYHASVAIVQQFYRPGHHSTQREMAARRRLAAVLNKLAEIDDTAGKRQRKPSGDAWPVKKARSDNGEESEARSWS